MLVFCCAFFFFLFFESGKQEASERVDLL